MTEQNPLSLKKRLFFTSTSPADDRSRMRAVANNLILHLHPTKVPRPALKFTYTWGLGTMMASWDKALSTADIDAIVAFLQHWDALNQTGIVLTPPAPIEIDLNNPQEVLALGERIFDTTGTACHGENDSGRPMWAGGKN